MELSYFRFQFQIEVYKSFCKSLWTEQSIIIIVVSVFSEWVSLWRFVEGKVTGTKNGH